jgi:hypothetical protein
MHEALRSGEGALDWPAYANYMWLSKGVYPNDESRLQLTMIFLAIVQRNFERYCTSNHNYHEGNPKPWPERYGSPLLELYWVRVITAVFIGVVPGLFPRG